MCDGWSALGPERQRAVHARAAQPRPPRSAAAAATYSVSLGTISAASKQPLAANQFLTTAAENHSQWMLDTDTFSHTGINGTDPGDCMVESFITYTLGTTLENLVLLGSADINGTGNAVANQLTGNAGNNLLDGKAGADSMAGGAGNDVYVVDNVGDVVSEDPSAGTDEIRSAVAP